MQLKSCHSVSKASMALSASIPELLTCFRLWSLAIRSCLMFSNLTWSSNNLVSLSGSLPFLAATKYASEGRYLCRILECSGDERRLRMSSGTVGLSGKMPPMSFSRPSRSGFSITAAMLVRHRLHPSVALLSSTFHNFDSLDSGSRVDRWKPAFESYYNVSWDFSKCPWRARSSQQRHGPNFRLFCEHEIA